MVALYIDSSTLCGFYLSWQSAPPQHCDHSIWDRVGFYTMHTFSARQLIAISNHFKPSSKLIFFQIGKSFKCASHSLHRKCYSPFQDPLQAKCSGHFEFKTLILLSSVFCKSLFLYQAIQLAVHAESVKPRVKKWDFCSLQGFQASCKQFGLYEFRQDLPSRDSCWVQHSGSMPKWELSSRAQRDWRIQSAWKGSGVVGHPSHTSPNGSSDYQGLTRARKPQDQASQWDSLQHVHLILREHRGISCTCCHSPTSHQPQGT